MGKLTCVSYDSSRIKAYTEDLHLKAFEMIKAKVKGKAWESQNNIDMKECYGYIQGIIDFEDKLEKALKEEELWQDFVISERCEYGEVKRRGDV